MVRLSPVAKAWRIGVALLFTALFVAGSLVGNDPWWPFGPWRMFATSQATTGSVWSTGIEIRTDADPTWHPAPLTPENTGLNRAEIEGRIPQIVADPAMLGTLAHSHGRLRPDTPAWTGVRVVRHEIGVKDGHVTGRDDAQVLAVWEATP
ncbi:conserved exported hypothetical protein [Nostocoides japonicum T1-X7]|uniref:Uncharacterized protein n=1 Tax=Nostocoides japonicum T1-X7 TaxID=1194083 RepID=A0A077LWW1_9MICO|nr:hypothetical protein [Tetrasphaera japonica]CCH77327.1 conserved exported hypothetical protein [Tetrasphaera japonica T1-X7]